MAATVAAVAIYLVRHAHAGTRGTWDGPDVGRPLSEKGLHQAAALAGALRDREVTRVLSSPATRCVQTVEPVAAERGLAVEPHPALLEGASPAETSALLWQLGAEGTAAVLASHGDVIPAALDALRRGGVAVDGRDGLPKGTYYVLEVDGDGAITSASFVDPRP